MRLVVILLVLASCTRVHETVVELPPFIVTGVDSTSEANVFIATRKDGEQIRIRAEVGRLHRGDTIKEYGIKINNK